MKYHYQKPEFSLALYGEKIELDHPVYKFGTLYSKDGKGIIVVQMRCVAKYLYWDSLDACLANDIYLSPNFDEFFTKNATDPPVIFQVRKLMWALRMKPLKKEYWEDYF